MCIRDRFYSGFTRAEYVEAVRKVKEYILAGDIYQANLSQRFSAPLLEPAWQLYRRLRRLNSAPFSAYLDFGDFAVASSSPERFLKVSGPRVETPPIKGTRPRSADPVEDARLKEELLSSAKDRAELSMICLLYTSDAADDLLCVDLGGRRIIKKKKSTKLNISMNK